MSREFDVIVFGASGFTGQFVVEEVAVSMDMDSLYKRDNLRWAIAGRSGDKLRKVLETAAEQKKLDWCRQVPIIENVQTDNYDSVLEMCRRTRLVINVVGPYRFFGEPVVKACVEAATNYVDISGEPEFLESMQLKYNEEAKQKGIHIVGAAGWDSIPADLGASWTKQQVAAEGGELNHLEIFVTADSEPGTPSGPQINFGTFHSAIYGLATADKLRDIRRRLYKEVLPLPAAKPKYKQETRSLLSYVDEIKGYCLPFMGSDKSVVRRSEVLKYNSKRERPLSCECYFKVDSIKSGLLIILAASFFSLMTKSSLTRSLLKRFPGFFSLGFVSKEGVSRAIIEKQTFKHVIIGYGWDEKLADPDLQHSSPPRRKILATVSGPNAGYTGTAILLVHAGMTLLFDKEKLCAPGVVSPGAAFVDSYLMDRLAKRGVKFQVLERS